MADAAGQLGETVAVINPAFIGDVLFSARVCDALVHHAPGTRIVFVARPPAHKLARFFPGVVHVEAFDKKRGDRGFRGTRRIAAVLKEHGVTTLISMHRGWRVADIARRMGPGVRTIGFRGLFGAAYDVRVPFHARETYFAREARLLAAAGVDDAPARMTMAVPPGHDGPRGHVVLAPGANYASKRWGEVRFAELARALVKKRIPVVLTGGPAEREMCARIAAAVPGVLDQCGESLEACAAHLRDARCCVANDSGIAHIARAVGTPTVMLFGPTSEAVHDTAREPTIALSAPEIACRPCSPHGDARCPRGHHRCMTTLLPADVLTAVGKVARAPR